MEWSIAGWQVSIARTGEERADSPKPVRQRVDGSLGHLPEWDEMQVKLATYVV